jgi:hypothetical protein
MLEDYFFLYICNKMATLSNLGFTRNGNFISNLEPKHLSCKSLYVDSDVSFANVTIEEDLQVNGTSDLSGDLIVDGTSELTGNLTVDGTSDLSGNVTIDSDLLVSGNTSLGTLNVTGAVILQNTLRVDGVATFTPTTNQIVLGTTNTTTINSSAPSASRVYTIPDAGGAASFVMTAGNQTVAGNKTFTGTFDVTGATILESTLRVDGQASFRPSSNQLVLGPANFNITLNAATPVSSVVYAIPDVGGAASFVMTAGTQTITGNKTLSGTTTASTVNITSGGLTLPTSGGTPSTLDYYESTTLSTTFQVQSSGANLTSTTVTCYLTRIGTTVILIIPAFTVRVGDTGGVTQITQTSGFVPGRFGPGDTSAAPFAPSQVVKVQTAAGTFSFGYITVTSSASGNPAFIRIFSSASDTAWTTSATVGLPQAVTLTYRFS